MRDIVLLRRRARRLPIVLLGLGALLLTACSGGEQAAVTVTSEVVVPATGGVTSSSGAVTDPTSASSSSSIDPTSSSADPSSTTPSTASTTKSGGASDGGVAYQVPAGDVVKTEPDGFTITKLRKGDKVPQFIVFSFDGVGWHEKWDYWFDLASKVPLHWTGFLSGTYMLSDATKDKYTGPGHVAGKSSIPWASASDLPVEIADLNKAVAAGDEIGTHFNGHFCDDNPPGGGDWNTADWNNELDQFFALVKDVDANNGISDQLQVDLSQVKGERTPCLTGHKADLYPALEAHGMNYDSSFTRVGLSWPTLSEDGKVWEMGMSEFPTHGTGHVQITMDYNYYAQQEPDAIGSGTPPAAAQSKIDSQQVLDTYADMYKAATTDGVNEPIILGNHFNDWNNNAYSDAVGNFALQYCGKENTYCVPFRDLVDWMEAQDPAVLADLQNHQSNLGGCPYDAWPKCTGLIQY
ncbi:polysaccharide deacetylase [Nakamurella sp. YIM 132087]|uniref:Polysaccharide deacetylase n=1 Tax=Nakamurella alba TaxID=2665158 RepID=A0A7K1FNC1_9ACTN|nr:polysaccharide deacetylase [Nakamurella alba]MTD15628.1 polysaccharide deacetylase [Nakamurella alba]